MRNLQLNDAIDFNHLPMLQSQMGHIRLHDTDRDTLFKEHAMKCPL